MDKKYTIQTEITRVLVSSNQTLVCLLLQIVSDLYLEEPCPTMEESCFFLKPLQFSPNEHSEKCNGLYNQCK